MSSDVGAKAPISPASRETIWQQSCRTDLSVITGSASQILVPAELFTPSDSDPSELLRSS